MIGICDCNSFFASCETLFRPDLRGKGVIVLSNNDGIIVALSKEAKKVGLHRGDAFFEIKEEAERNGITTFSSNYALYQNISNRIMSTLRYYSDDIYPYSIDEAFFTPRPDEDFPALRAAIVKRTGMMVTIGIGRTMTLAKAANHIGKSAPSGVCMLTEENEEQALSSLPVEEVWGIGWRSAKKLRLGGITSAKAFRDLPDDFIRKNYTITGLRCAYELRGVNAHTESDQLRSFCSGISFEEVLETFSALYEALCIQTQSLTAKMAKHNVVASSFAISIFTSRFTSDFYAPVVSSHLEVPTDYMPRICALIQSLLESCYLPGRYKGCRIWAYDLQAKGERQYSLFETKEERERTDKEEKLATTIQELTHRYGRGAIRPGAFMNRGKSDLIQRARKSPAYTTSFAELPEINN